MDYMDTVDPRIERAFTKTGVHRRVNVPRYRLRGALTLTIVIAALIAIFA